MDDISMEYAPIETIYDDRNFLGIGTLLTKMDNKFILDEFNYLYPSEHYELTKNDSYISGSHDSKILLGMKSYSHDEFSMDLNQKQDELAANDELMKYYVQNIFGDENTTSSKFDSAELVKLIEKFADYCLNLNSVNLNSEPQSPDEQKTA